MVTIIIGAIVNLLIFFFERWWTAHHPDAPTTEARTAFVDHVGKFQFFILGSKRQDYAGKLFDKFAANYRSNPPLTSSPGILSEESARALAQKYAVGLTLTPAEQ